MGAYLYSSSNISFSAGKRSYILFIAGRLPDQATWRTVGEVLSLMLVFAPMIMVHFSQTFEWRLNYHNSLYFSVIEYPSFGP